MKFRKKPVEIEAVQLTPFTIEDVPRWCRRCSGRITPVSVAQDATDATETPARTPGGSGTTEARTEAQGGGHPTHIEKRIVCAKCGQLLGGFHKGCDGTWIEQRRVVQEWWS